MSQTRVGVRRWATLQQLGAPLDALIGAVPLHVSGALVHADHHGQAVEPERVLDTRDQLDMDLMFCTCAADHPLARALQSWEPVLDAAEAVARAQPFARSGRAMAVRLAAGDVLTATLAQARYRALDAGLLGDWEAAVRQQVADQLQDCRAQMRRTWRAGPLWTGPARYVLVPDVGDLPRVSGTYLAEIRRAAAAWPTVHVNLERDTIVVAAPGGIGAWEQKPAYATYWVPIGRAGKDLVTDDVWSVFDLLIGAGYPPMQSFADAVRVIELCPPVQVPTLLRFIGTGLSPADALVAADGVLAV